MVKKAQTKHTHSFEKVYVLGKATPKYLVCSKCGKTKEMK